MQTSPGGRKSTPATTPPVGAPDRNANGATAPRHATRRLSTETKAAFKTTEFFAYVAVLADILIAGALVDSSDAGGYGARQVWLYATVLTVGLPALPRPRQVRQARPVRRRRQRPVNRLFGCGRRPDRCGRVRLFGRGPGWS